MFDLPILLYIRSIQTLHEALGVERQSNVSLAETSCYSQRYGKLVFEVPHYFKKVKK